MIPHNPFISFWVGVVCLVGFVFLGFSVGGGGVIDGIDRAVTDIVVEGRSPAITEVMKLVTTFGELEFLLALSFLFAGTLVYLRKWEALIVMFITFGTIAYITGLSKFFFGRMRPEEMLLVVGGTSFPSGHTSGAFMVALVLGWIVASVTPKGHHRFLVLTLSSVGAMLIGVSRIYLGVHWASDVLGGMLLATGVSLIVISIATIIEHHFNKMHSRIKKRQK